MSIQKVDIPTWRTGPSPSAGKASDDSEPIQNSPAGIFTMPSLDGVAAKALGGEATWDAPTRGAARSAAGRSAVASLRGAQ
ncbi:hypothetical protein GCM10009841_34370 [Microlunatus panaciterrae]